MASMKCQHVWRYVSDYIDDDVDAGLRALITEHLKVCAHCTAVVDGARNVVRLVADGRVFEIPLGYSQRLAAKLSARISGEGSES